MHHGDIECFFTPEWGIALEHGVHDTSEGIDIASAVEFFAFSLFRAHVFGCTADDAAARNLFGTFGAGDDFCESEIDDFNAQMGAWIVHDEDVFRLEVAVNDALHVSLGQTPADLKRDARSRDR